MTCVSGHVEWHKAKICVKEKPLMVWGRVEFNWGNTPVELMFCSTHRHGNVISKQADHHNMRVYVMWDTVNSCACETVFALNVINFRSLEAPPFSFPEMKIMARNLSVLKTACLVPYETAVVTCQIGAVNRSIWGAKMCVVSERINRCSLSVQEVHGEPAAAAVVPVGRPVHSHSS